MGSIPSPLMMRPYSFWDSLRADEFVEITGWKLPVKLGSELAIVRCGQHTIQVSGTSSGESLSLRVPSGLTL